MQNTFFFIGLILVIGGGGRAIFQGIFLLLGASGQAGAALSKNLNKDEESRQKLDENLANIKEFNKTRVKVIIRLAIAGAVGAAMMYASQFMGPK